MVDSCADIIPPAFFYCFSSTFKYTATSTKNKTTMRYTTLALCLFLFGNSWAQKNKQTIHENGLMIVDQNIGLHYHHDGVTIYNYDSNTIQLMVRDRKTSHPISFSYLPYKEYKRLYSIKGKTLYIRITRNMGYGRSFNIFMKFKRPPRKHRGVFFYDIFLSISASLSAIYCLSDALLKKYTYSPPQTISPITI